jgi:hypothetical protein
MSFPCVSFSSRVTIFGFFYRVHCSSVPRQKLEPQTCCFALGFWRVRIASTPRPQRNKAGQTNQGGRPNASAGTNTKLGKLQEGPNQTSLGQPNVILGAAAERALLLLQDLQFQVILWKHNGVWHVNTDSAKQRSGSATSTYRVEESATTVAQRDQQVRDHVLVELHRHRRVGRAPDEHLRTRLVSHPPRIGHRKNKRHSLTSLGDSARSTDADTSSAADVVTD